MSYRADMVRRVGRPPHFETAEDLWQGFVDYVDFVDRYPVELPMTMSKTQKIVGTESTGKGGTVARPLTLDGFTAFHGIGSEWRVFARDQRARGEDFSTVIARIVAHTRKDQIEGGMAGIYNSNLTARLNGLTEKTRNDITSNGESVGLTLRVTQDVAEMLKEDSSNE